MFIPFLFLSAASFPKAPEFVSRQRCRFLPSFRAILTRTRLMGFISYGMPNADLQAILRKDYDQMDEMFPPTRLSFDDILRRLEVLQQRINAMKKN